MEVPKFEVKDSGERKQFDSGMVRDVTEGKVNFALVADGPLLRRWAVHLTKGAKKYSPRNWMKARGQEELDRFRESAFRHFMQWYYGETDEDHAAAVVFNMNGAEYVKESQFTTPLQRLANMPVKRIEFHVPTDPWAGTLGLHSVRADRWPQDEEYSGA